MTYFWSFIVLLSLLHFYYLAYGFNCTAWNCKWSSTKL